MGGGCRAGTPAPDDRELASLLDSKELDGSNLDKSLDVALLYKYVCYIYKIFHRFDILLTRDFGCQKEGERQLYSTYKR